MLLKVRPLYKWVELEMRSTRNSYGNNALLKLFNTRNSSSSGNILKSLDDNSGIATIKFNRPPVNTLNQEFLTQFVDIITEYEKTKLCKGIIITSAIPNVFCAGLDIMEMHKPDVDRFCRFWRAVQEMWIKLYATPLITMAAVTGNAPGAGCIVALCCDYRVMLDSKCTIGISGTKLGMISPWWFQKTLENTVGQRETEIALSLGKAYSPREALEKGFVDDIASSSEEVMVKIQNEMKKWIKVPDRARAATKQQLRGSVVGPLLKSRDMDIKSYVASVNERLTQEAITAYLETLKQRKK